MRSGFRTRYLLAGLVLFAGLNQALSGFTQDQQENPDPVGQSEELFSGPQIGELLPELAALSLLDDSADRVIIVPGNPEKLQMVIFLHERTRPAFGLLRGLALYSKHLGEKIDSSAVFLADDVSEPRQWSVNARGAIPDGARMFVSEAGIEGPGTWGLNRNATMTIVIGRDGKTLGNFAIVQPNMADDLEKISGSIASALEIDPPTGEQLADWAGTRQMQGEATPTVDIRTLLAPVIQKTATPENVEAAAARVEQRAAEDNAFKIAVGDACRRIVSGGVLENYGTEPARVWLRAWADRFVVDPESEMKDKENGSEPDVEKPGKGERDNSRRRS